MIARTSTMLLPYVVMSFILASNGDFFTSAKTEGFGCPDTMISDHWRQMIVDYINNGRRRIAMGNQVGKDGVKLPKAMNMTELFWDCNLEEVVRADVKSCPLTFDYKNYGWNAKTVFWDNPCNITSITASLFDLWWSYVKNLGTDLKYKENLRYFVDFANARHTAFGCSYWPCHGGTLIKCVYNSPMLKIDELLYEQGETCTNCKGKCENHLCQLPFIPDVYPTPSCESSPMTNHMRNISQKMHNYYRRQLATGWAKDMVSGYAPRAKAMLALRYDCNIEKAAVTHAKKCTMSHSNSGGRAENILKIESTTIDHGAALKHAISYWWRELETYGVETDNIFTEKMKNEGKVVNYANMAWDKAAHVGCGVNTCGAFTVVVCQYGPNAIAVGSKIYEEGKPCSDCPTKTECESTSVTAKGLCESVP